ncbi:MULTISPECIES: hopanoid biosynthesis associated radical SAM protein HpnJ [Sphingomonas]|uniref:Hopanoid biosynthesis associated radical SAM protein HpnJ n=1 Tax=Sphingomonas lycopersici TaxID=2951807 RepID=A0AA41ZEN4_9SPHN|nr:MULTISPECIES: hopanoid biosynthesis associated radical SAM protein HpnJ [Sphingomonas]MCW6533081.1 hopanoid biosynthesis associated radical SAM protein HpnJ [Sphingomonas lycopersici]MCW6537691.1 hopanoid biosynthesis associated radical SAM protein HpnJ [Sphingomonas lycopersici]OJU23449.1 MAG: hopanoid biosynthesis associated radical SAM protein HpnJ [Sphingomonas sp. 66-10]
MTLRTLFMQAPSFDGYDGGAGARYQMKREVRSFWYPTWLAQPAAMVAGSRLIDAPAHDQSWEDIAHEVDGKELVILHTSTPSFNQDIRTAALIKARNPKALVGFVGAKVAVEPDKSLAASEHVDFVAREEYDFTILDIAEGKPLAEVDGITWRAPDGAFIRNKDRAPIEDMDVLPMVSPVYKRDLTIEKYFGGYLRHPYVSFYTGRGCKSRCTFCLWPQTISGHNYRYRSVPKVIEEVQYILKEIPQTKEIFFDDDTLTDNHERVEELARALGALGFGKPGFPVSWSCNAKANVPRKTLEVLKANGLRLLLVGYESGNQKILHNIKKGLRVDVARQFTKDCHELGIVIHGTFILGLPGETLETIEETIEYAKEINPHTIQVSLAAPYPGTFLYKQATENGWFDGSDHLLTDGGNQIAQLSYPHLPASVIFDKVEEFYKRFYFRPRKIGSIVGEMLRDFDMMKRRLREGVEFFDFLRRRKEAA